MTKDTKEQPLILRKPEPFYYAVKIDDDPTELINELAKFPFFQFIGLNTSQSKMMIKFIVSSTAFDTINIEDFGATFSPQTSFEIVFAKPSVAFRTTEVFNKYVKWMWDNKSKIYNGDIYSIRTHRVNQFIKELTQIGVVIKEVKS